VTGATGLIGSAIAQQLVDAGHEVVALVRPGTGASGLEAIGVRIARGDLTDPPSVRAAVAGCDGAFHSAALVGLPKQDRAESERVNVGGTTTLLDAAREAGVGRVVAISTSGVFDSDMTLTEHTPVHPDPPDDPYTITKIMAFQQTMRRVEDGQDIVIVLPGASFGPSPMARRVVEIPGGDQRICRALRGEPARYLPMTAPWSSITDVAGVSLAAFERGVTGERYLGLGAPDCVMTITQFVNRAMEVAGVDNRVTEIGRDELDDPAMVEQFGPTLVLRARMPPRHHPAFDATETSRVLDYQFVPVDQRLGETVEWMRRTGLV
jgi:nucleoside-diphosphate-sugar epimerase